MSSSSGQEIDAASKHVKFTQVVSQHPRTISKVFGLDQAGKLTRDWRVSRSKRTHSPTWGLDPRRAVSQRIGADAKHADVDKDLDEARRFLAAFSSDAVFTFQTFAERANVSNPGALGRVFHGSFDEHAEALSVLNDRGAGVFFMVNRGDGQIRAGRKTCRTAENVTAIRALFVDLDGSPVAPVYQWELAPTLVVESSPGRWHAYWLISGCPLGEFRELQKGLAEHFHGDVAVNDLGRVMRLPGFVHQKGKPFIPRIVWQKLGEQK